MDGVVECGGPFNRHYPRSDRGYPRQGEHSSGEWQLRPACPAAVAKSPGARVVKVMQHLRPLEVRAHAQLLMALARPMAAAAYLAALPFSLEPRLSLR
eukprot:615445-Pyramimonas_sp.AAC.2